MDEIEETKSPNDNTKCQNDNDIIICEDESKFSLGCMYRKFSIGRPWCKNEIMFVLYELYIKLGPLFLGFLARSKA